jgi:hypothetical protein
MSQQGNGWAGTCFLHHPRCATVITMKRLPVLFALLGLLLGATLAAPATALGRPAARVLAGCTNDAYPPSPHATIMASTTTPTVGETIEASGVKYCANEDVALTLDGAAVGTAHTDGQGSFDPPVVVNKAGSALQLCGIGASGLPTDRDCITLSTTSNNQGTGGGSNNSNGGGTAFTGLDVAALCLLAAVLLLAGGGLVVSSRRKRVAATRS